MYNGIDVLHFNFVVLAHFWIGLLHTYLVLLQPHLDCEIFLQKLHNFFLHEWLFTDEESLCCSCFLVWSLILEGHTVMSLWHAPAQTQIRCVLAPDVINQHLFGFFV